MSPDLAPIENVWQLLKVNLRKRKITTYQQLVATIKKEWKKLSPNFVMRLVQSMDNRISEVIQSQGDFIFH